MKQKLIIVNNGLRDHLGHYFETSVALAEAARRAGLHPVLATHVDCRVDLLPTWLESYPIFCTDHWMTEPPADPQDLSGIPLDPYASPQGALETIRCRESTVRQFLASRYETFRDQPTPAPPPPPPPSALKRLLKRAAWACRKTIWAADRSAFYFLPPFLYDGASFLIKTAWRLCVPRILRRECQERVRRRSVQLAKRFLGISDCDSIDLAACTPELCRSLQHPIDHPIVKDALFELGPRSLLDALEYALIFKRDLERLLALAGAGAGDHVLLGTAHARELLAIQLIAKRYGESRTPEFHLEFRHSLFQAEPSKDELASSPNIDMQRAFFSIYEAHGPSTHVHFYTDTKELSHDYGLISKSPFGVLPIPFRSEFIESSRPAPDQPLRLAFFGEARDEKGFPWLPDLIDELMDAYVLPGKVRLLLQANVSAPQYNPRSSQALEKLKRHPRQQVELFGLEAPLSPQEYYRLVSQADVVLLPYDRNRYRACSSGTLAEAIAGGRPAIVPANSWMSSQLAPGIGETFHDYESFVAGVKRVIDNYDEYRNKAEAFRSNWTALHRPDCLVSRLVGRGEAVVPEACAA